MMEAISWSEIKTWQHCPQQWWYKYDQRLVPKEKQLPLYKGNWVHAAIESHYRDGDWRLGHKLYLDAYNKLFEEEQAELNKKGNLPSAIEGIVKSYLWYYRNDGWKIVAVEQSFTVDTPLGPFDGRIDLIIEVDGRLWVVDHKTTATIPPATAFHAMDPQLMIYPWAAKQVWGMDIAGVIYNYIRSRPPSIPKLNKDRTISKRKIVTDYPTLYRFLKENGRDPKDYSEALLPLMKKSPLLRRYRLPREKHVTKAIILDSWATMKQIRSHKRIIRIITKDCQRCPFQKICRADLNGMDTDIMRKVDFTVKPKEIAFGKYDSPEYEEESDSREGALSS